MGWLGTEYSATVKYLNNEGARASLEGLSGRLLPHISETYRRNSRTHEESAARELRKAFKQGTGLVLAYVETWIRENLQG